MRFIIFILLVLCSINSHATVITEKLGLSTVSTQVEVIADTVTIKLDERIARVTTNDRYYTSKDAISSNAQGETFRFVGTDYTDISDEIDALMAAIKANIGAR